ncbi:MAG: hypothetical protein VX683_02840, partial [Cyanobacteriota bacterium]|nr:hypothetical protein [Cyanobacteriota bacterium]
LCWTSSILLRYDLAFPKIKTAGGTYVSSNSKWIGYLVTPLEISICDEQWRDAPVMMTIIHRCDYFAID